MPERGTVPVSEVMGNGKTVKVEESWSKFLPSTDGAEGVGTPEIDRTSMIMDAVKRRREGTHLQIAIPGIGIEVPKFKAVPIAPEIGLKNGEPVMFVPVGLEVQNFFVMKGKKMEFIGSREVDLTKFKKDLSGRFFREWVKVQFPGRRDYEDVVSFGDSVTMKEVVGLMAI